MLLLRRALKVREDLRDDLRLLDAGHDREPAAARGTALDLDAKQERLRSGLEAALVRADDRGVVRAWVP